MKKIRLSQGLFTLVDAEDFERLNQFKWTASLESRRTKMYAVRWKEREGKKVKIRMHREVMCIGTGAEDSRVVDHLDHDSLDNRKCNLEIIDQTTNMKRSPGWKKKKIKLKEKKDSCVYPGCQFGGMGCTAECYNA